MDYVFHQFIEWTKKKIRLHVNDDRELFFYEREICWAALGKNIGYEMDGKHELFERPVLIIKKYSKHTCFILPLTTRIKPHNPSYQYIFDWNKKQHAVNLSQGRTMSQKRLLRKMGKIDNNLYQKIIDSFVSLLNK